MVMYCIIHGHSNRIIHDTYWIVCVCIRSYETTYTQVGFAEFNNTADNRANIGGTIIGAPIVGQ